VRSEHRTSGKVGSASHETVDVAYIGGTMRSGSTLLHRMLSRVAGFVSVGEVAHIWERGVSRNELCGCGAPFHDCPFWTQVGSVAYRGWDRLDVTEVRRLQRAVDRTRYIPLMIAARDGAGRYGRRLHRYADLLSRLYGAIRDVSGADIVVDSSKHASTAFLLRRVPQIRLHVVHLVRDSHGVAYSLTRQVTRPEVTAARAYMPTATPVRAGVEWVMVNGLFHGIRATGVPTTFLMYESLVRHPESEIRRIARALGKDVNLPAEAVVRDGIVQFTPDHTVSGNPMRFTIGNVVVRPDDAWRRSMPRTDRAVTTAVTWPLLARYGYPLGTRR
jgi:Sulfotransferase family